MYAIAQSAEFRANTIRLGDGVKGSRIGMNRDRWLGIWKQVMGKAKEQWGTATGDPFAIDAGTRDQLLGKIQERRGASKQEADRQLTHFIKRNRNWSNLSRR